MVKLKVGDQIKEGKEIDFIVQREDFNEYISWLITERSWRDNGKNS